MIPIPQYPLYSATIALYGGRQIGYLLDEENSWQLNESILAESIDHARKQGTKPVGIVVINPGNPTGAVLSDENIRMIITFAKRNGLSIIADEVYQENVYDKADRFHSFAKTMHQMGEKEVTLFSLHSVSKGYLGECGHRGGYLEFRNLPDDVLAQFVKLQSIALCANLVGQFATYLMVSPPVPGNESFEMFVRERDGVLASLKRKAEILGEEINGIEGMSVDIPRGAMYAFVRFDLPPEKGVDLEAMSREEHLAYEAKRDSDYCMSLLEETGICVVPGSGFGQRPGTLHFRTTFLPPQDEIEAMVKKLKTFHEKYVRELEEV
jgi:aspartate/methionine/tyrosine aminotransferase